MCYIVIAGFCSFIISMACAYKEYWAPAYASLVLGAALLLSAIFSIESPPHPYPTIPVEKYKAFLNSGYRFYVESNKVYAVKNEVMYLGPYSVNVESKK